MPTVLSNDQIIELAESLLSHRFGGSQQLFDVEDLGGTGNSVVLRARVATTPFLQQRSVVLKYSPTTGDLLDDAAIVREVAAYQFTNTLPEDVRPGPMLLAHDIDERILVLSDSGDGDTLADLLVQPDPELRQHILRNLGTALGKMHSSTANQEANFNVLLTRMLRQHPTAEPTKDIRDRALIPAIGLGLSLVENSHIDVPVEVKDLAETAQRRLNASRTRGFTPFDLSPDNIIVAERTQFLDYEWAGFRDVYFDLACVIAGFPQFLSTRPINDDEVAVFLDAWVYAVRDVWPNVTQEEHLHNRIVTALVGWGLSSVAMMHFGSPNTAVEALAWSDPAVDHVGGSDLLKSSHDHVFSSDEKLVRQDLYETFESFARFAGGGRAASSAVIAQFATEVAGRLKDAG